MPLFCNTWYTCVAVWQHLPLSTQVQLWQHLVHKCSCLTTLDIHVQLVGNTYYNVEKLSCQHLLHFWSRPYTNTGVWQCLLCTYDWLTVIGAKVLFIDNTLHRYSWWRGPAAIEGEEADNGNGQLKLMRVHRHLSGDYIVIARSSHTAINSSFTINVQCQYGLR